MAANDSESVNIPCDLDINVEVSKRFGDKICGGATGGFISCTTNGAPGVVGILGEFTTEGTTSSVRIAETLRCARFLSVAVAMEIYNNGKHIMEYYSKYSFIKVKNGNRITRETLGIGYRHERGHGVRLALSQICAYNSQILDLTAKACLWGSPDKGTTLELGMSATYHLSGRLAGKGTIDGALSFIHRM